MTISRYVSIITFSRPLSLNNIPSLVKKQTNKTAKQKQKDGRITNHQANHGADTTGQYSVHY